MSAQRRQSGFSAIEALVALAIIAIALLPLLSLQSQVSRDFAQQRALRAQIIAQRDSLAILRDLNIAEATSGARPLGAGASMRWTAQPISQPVRSTFQGAGEGQFELVLYRIDVVVVRQQGETSAFSVEQLGWRSLALPARP